VGVARVEEILEIEGSNQKDGGIVEAGRLANAIVKWIIKVEEVHFNKSLFYAEDYKKTYGIKQGTKWFGEQGWASEKHFKKVSSQMVFELLPGVSPSSAIKAFFSPPGERPTICECHSLVIAVLYRAILSVVGEGLFDQCFNNMYICSRLGYDECPLKKLICGIVNQQKAFAPYRIGDWAIFDNHPEYKLRHPSGAAMGWNIICTGFKDSDPQDPMWRGFGLGMASVTTSQFMKMMFDYYVQMPEEDDIPNIERRFAVKFSGSQLEDLWGEYVKGDVMINRGPIRKIGIPKGKTKRLSATRLNKYLAERLEQL
jgi:hypothetical protein